MGVEYFIYGMIGGLILIFLTRKKEPEKYIPTREDRNDSNRFMQEHEDMMQFARYCHYREEKRRKIEEVNQYKDLPKEKWWYYFEIGMIHIDWIEPQTLEVYEVYDDKTAKYLHGDMREQMKKEYDTLYPEFSVEPKYFIPEH